MRLLCRIAGPTLYDRMRSLEMWMDLKIEQWSQLKWFGHLMRMPPGRLPGELVRSVPLGGVLGDPGHAGGIISYSNI